MSVLVPVLTGLGGAALGVLGHWLFIRWQVARGLLTPRHDHTYGDGDFQ